MKTTLRNLFISRMVPVIIPAIVIAFFLIFINMLGSPVRASEEEKPKKTINAEDMIFRLEITNNKKFLIIKYYGTSVINILNLDNGKNVNTLKGHNERIRDIKLSPDGKYLASGSDDQTIKLWNVEDPVNAKLIKSLEGHTDKIINIEFSPNGKYLASGSIDKTIKLWNVEDPVDAKLIKSLDEQTYDINTIAFSPDGKYLASGSDDRTIKLWNVEDPVNAKLMKTLQGHSDHVNSIKFFSQGKELVSTGRDGKILFWDHKLPIGEPIGAIIPKGQENSVLLEIKQKDEVIEKQKIKELSKEEKIIFNKTTFNKTRKKIEMVRRTLKSEFAGIDDRIDFIMNNIAKIELDPQDVKQPIVIGFMGVPGTGKTSLPQRVVELMGYNKKFFQDNIADENGKLPIELLFSQGELDGDEGKSINAVLLWDEITKLGVKDKNNSEKQQNYRKGYLAGFDKGQLKMKNDRLLNENKQQEQKELDNFNQMVKTAIEKGDKSFTEKYLLERSNKKLSNDQGVFSYVRPDDSLGEDYMRGYNKGFQNGEQNNVEGLNSLTQNSELIDNSAAIENLWQILGNGTMILNPKIPYKTIIQRYSELAPAIYQSNFFAKELEQEINSIKEKIKIKEAELPQITSEIEKVSNNKNIEIAKIKEEIKKQNLQETTKEFQELQSKISLIEQTANKNLETLNSKKSEIENNLKKLKENELGKGDALAKQKLAYEDLKIKLEKLMNDTKIDYPKLVAKYNLLANMLESIQKSYVSFLKDLDAIQIAPKKIMHFGRILIFMTGNPSFINDVVERYSKIPEDKIKPDDYHEAIKQRVTPENIDNTFEKIFGKTAAAFKSRMNIEKWREFFFLPLSQKQWEELIEKKLARFSNQFQERLSEMSINSSISFDDSINKMLYNSAISPLQGPRCFESTATGILHGPVLVDLLGKIVDIVDNNEKVPGKIEISFNPTTKLLRAYTLDKNKTALLEVKLNVTNRCDTLKDTLSDDSALQRQAIQQASYAITGMILNGSIPKKIENQSYENSSDLARMWSDPQIKNYHKNTNLAYNLIGGFLGERLFLNNSVVSEKGDNYHTHILDIVNEIKKDLDYTRKVDSVGLKNNQLPLALEKIIPQELAENKIFQAIDKGEKETLIPLIRKAVTKLLTNQKGLVLAITDKLLKENKILLAEQIKEIVKEKFYTGEKKIIAKIVKYLNESSKESTNYEICNLNLSKEQLADLNNVNMCVPIEKLKSTHLQSDQLEKIVDDFQKKSYVNLSTLKIAEDELTDTYIRMDIYNKIMQTAFGSSTYDANHILNFNSLTNMQEEDNEKNEKNEENKVKAASKKNSKYTNRKLKNKSKGFIELLFSDKTNNILSKMCDERVLW
ncbi:MAG: hypothetical protein HQK49_05280 [Oligoflexia bacterium]|nr:hypothetical protein [Oligoflexia bacterium]